MKTSKKSLEYLPLNYTETGPINILLFHIIYGPGIPERSGKDQKKNERRTREKQGKIRRKIKNPGDPGKSPGKA
ncbi:TPA: hypothetical protein HA351_01040 [Methanosarcinaceae archaeon]|nr:hypothetical protein [Methanosarcinaceae archaeon]